MEPISGQLAVITGASTGIGLELARLCAQQRLELIIAADEPLIEKAAQELKQSGVACTAVQCDLATAEGVAKLTDAIAATGRPVDMLLANAGRGLGNAFLDQDLDEAMRVIHTNIDGTVRLIYAVAKGMRDRGQDRILITGSIAGLMPGTFQAVYNGSKAFLDSFAVALSNELEPTGITVTCLMPGATETDFFERADMTDTKVGSGEKMAAADVAKVGFHAMMKGELKVVAGMANKCVLPWRTSHRIRRSPICTGAWQSPAVVRRSLPSRNKSEPIAPVPDVAVTDKCKGPPLRARWGYRRRAMGSISV